MCVTVDTISGPLDIVNVHCLHQESFEESWLHDLFQRGNVLICDDFTKRNRF